LEVVSGRKSLNGEKYRESHDPTFKSHSASIAIAIMTFGKLATITVSTAKIVVAINSVRSENWKWPLRIGQLLQPGNRKCLGSDDTVLSASLVQGAQHMSLKFLFSKQSISRAMNTATAYDPIVVRPRAFSIDIHRPKSLFT
jgi:hypothetical protein